MRFAAPLHVDPTPAFQMIEVSSSFHIPHVQIIGLPSQEIFEARERVKSAIESCGLTFPKRRIIINLSPASIKKRGTGVDLAIALGILCAHHSEVILDPLAVWVAWGELSLDGTVQPCGKLTRTIMAASLAQAQVLLISSKDFEAARKVLSILEQSGAIPETTPLSLIGVETLKEAWEILSQKKRPHLDSSSAPLGLTVQKEKPKSPPSLLNLPAALDRVIGVSACGFHHLLLLGPRGTGKTYALDWLHHLLPPPALSQRIESTLVAELREDYPAFSQPSHPSSPNSSVCPAICRRVGMQVKATALIGSASNTEIRPGEFAMAHGGLLIADEYPEWPKDAREALREPLERGTVTLTRTRASIAFPARFQLAATGNLCPCGGWPPEMPTPPMSASQKRSLRCRCKVGLRKLYWQRFSGPVLDRIDMVHFVTHSEAPVAKSSRFLEQQEKVFKTQETLLRRWGQLPGSLAPVDTEAILQESPKLRLGLNQIEAISLRSRHKILRVALTLASWDNLAEPHDAHFFEASLYRPEFQIKEFSS